MRECVLQGWMIGIKRIGKMIGGVAAGPFWQLFSRVKRDAQTAEFQREGMSDDQSEWEAEAGRWRSFG